MNQSGEQGIYFGQTNPEHRYIASELIYESFYKETMSRDNEGRYIAKSPVKGTSESVKGYVKEWKCYERLEQKWMNGFIV